MPAPIALLALALGIVWLGWRHYQTPAREGHVHAPRASNSASRGRGTAPARQPAGPEPLNELKRPLTAVEAASFVHNRACYPCHAAICEEQAASRHARTLRPVMAALDDAIFRHSNPVTDRIEHTAYHAQAQDGSFSVEEDTPAGRRDLPVDFVIGSGRGGYTYLSEAEKNLWMDLRISYYPAAHVWDFTPMQQSHHNAPAPADGVPLSGKRPEECLSCHVTYLRSDAAGLDIEDSYLGVGCERCHGPGSAHVATAAPMENLSKASQARITQLCGSCHETDKSSPPGKFETERDLPRLSGAALMRSRCFTESKTLTCITCHDPHRDADNTRQAIDKICLSCHNVAEAAHLSPGNTVLHVCPVNPRTGCTNCHMPRQSIVGVPDTVLTNHWIKVWPGLGASAETSARTRPV